MRKTFLNLMAFGALVLWAAATAPAQTGGAFPTWDELRTADNFRPEPMADSVAIVDLRLRFPPVGEQKINDCTAWAVSAVKSYLEAVDQGWKPDAPDREFSPSFIYNQINGGRDQGSSPLTASQLLIEVGAATKTQVPYTPHDYLSQPDPKALEMAGNFRNRGHALLGNGREIREALMRDLPVVIGARITPPFFGGKFESYSAAIHRQGMAVRRPDQPHALHAMVVVGFNDHRRAFLVRNSWGKNWGNAGYCWVGYEVMDSVDPSRSSDAFLMLAMVLLDEAMPLTRQDDLEGISPQVNWTYAGYDELRQRHRSRYSVRLRGASETLRRIERVDWTLPAGEEDFALSATDFASGFRAWSVHAGPIRPGRGLVHFRDGTRTSLEFQPQAPAQATEARRLQLIGEHWPDHLGRGEYRLWLAGDLTDLADVREVVYRRVLENGQTVPLANGDADQPGHPVVYAFSARGDTFVARIRFSDGGTTELEHKPVFEAPMAEGIRIRWSYRDTGDPDLGYAVRVWLEMPSSEARMQEVIWELDGSQDYRQHVVNDRWNRFGFETYAKREFSVTAMFFLPQTGSRRNRVTAWIELPEPAKFTNPYRLMVLGEPRYLGLNSEEQPHWAVDVRLTGDLTRWTSPGLPPVVQWQDSDGRIREIELHRGIDEETRDWHSYPEQPIVTRQRDLPVSIRFRQWVGNNEPDEEHAFEDLLTIRQTVSEHVVPRLRNEPADDAIRWHLDLSGSQQIRNIRRLEAIYPSRYLDTEGRVGGLAQTHAVLGEQVVPRADVMRLADTSLEPGRATLRLHFMDGSMQELAVPIGEEAGSPYDEVIRSAGRVRLLERFLGAESPDSHFEAAFDLEGVPDYLDSIESFTVVPIDSAAPEQTGTAGQTARFAIASPTGFQVTVRYKDGTTDRQTMRAGCLSSRWHDLQPKREGDYLFLAGPAEAIRRITEARAWWNAPTPMLTTEQVFLPLQSYGPGSTRFTHHRRNLQPLQAVVGVTLDDGSQLEFGEWCDQPIYPQARPFVEHSYWGPVEGKPTWLVTVRWPQTPETLDDLSFRFVPEGSGEAQAVNLPMPSAPDYAVRFLTGYPGRVEAVRRLKQFPEDSRAVPVVLTEPVRDALTLVQEKTWEDQSPRGRPDEWTLRLAGSYAELSQVRSVRYRIGEGREGLSWHSYDRFSLDGDGYRAVYFAREPAFVEAVVEFRDGRESRRLRLAPGEFR